MKLNSPKIQTERKVVFSFFLAATFLLAVSGLTYYTLNRLLALMDQLSQPDQKLSSLNKLQAEIIQITQAEGSGSKEDFRVQDSTLNNLESRLDELESLASTGHEREDIQGIRSNLLALVTGYENLYEVKSNLANRNFSQEALRKVELGIRRRAEVLETQPLRELNLRDSLYNDLWSTPNGRADSLNHTRNLERSFSQISKKPEMRRLIGYLQRDSLSPSNHAGSLDSILVNIHEVIERIYREESLQRGNLAQLEEDLSIRQGELIARIQDLLGVLQKRILEDSKFQYQQAYGLAFDVTVFLIILGVFAVLGSGFMVYSILKEIKLVRRYQDDLELARQKSDQLAKSKQEFLANMSHEIRNPLHVIQGYCAVLGKSPLGKGQKAHLRMIGYASETLMEIVDEVLDFSKLEAGKLKLEMKPFDPEELFGSLMDFFELKAQEKALDFRWKFDLPEHHWLVGDPLRIKQILSNLLSNAFKFTPNGWIEVRVNWGDHHLFVEVEDSGIGMSQEVLSKVFEEFDQADSSISRKYGGTGLGLAIVHRLVLLMGGRILPQSEEGKGTRMQITIPMEMVVAESPQLTQQDELVLNLTGKRILLVDDDPIGLQYLALILHYFGAETIIYEGGLAFRDEFEGESFDLAILDIQMSEVSGFDVVKLLQAHARYQDQPIIAMTANVFVEEKEKLMQWGFSDILFKPFQEKRLIAVLSKFFPEGVNRVYLPAEHVEPRNDALFDLADLNRFCMGDGILLRDILKDLMQETAKNMEQLRKARLSNRYEQILEICHQLGSRLGQLKAESGDLARKIETSLKLGNSKATGPQLILLDQKVKELLVGLQRFIDSKGIADS
ncbi:ATP-binding protein [Algoriphagus sp.]|uniref:hybrid sensor histidine kinase/response regulator n=1 Tax=Algoriphagus sp. TaxID=1872435 RepID=UPI002629A170|nr:ATP-binding protein [Algoriphagus sp.]